MQSNDIVKTSNSYRPVRIGDRSIGMESSCFVIAEIGSNHDG